jgi:putative ABC transport system substrate-binding protein
MNRREALLGLAAIGSIPAALAQSGATLPRIGFLSPVAPDARRDALVEGLRELGYVDGKTMRLEMRFAEGKPERLAGLAAELVAWAPDVLIAGSTIGARAAKKATGTIPIVFAGSSDPVAGGLVSNLARPEGNVTGFSLAYGDAFAGKWLELLKEACPELSAAAVLWSSSNAAAARFVREIEAAAKSLGVRIDAHHAANAAQLDAALAGIAASGADGLIVAPSPFAATRRRQLIAFAAEKRLRAMYFVADFAEGGGLMSYGPSIVDTYRRAATYVDRILKGARPAALPVEQPTRFELVINLKTARALGADIPRAVLLRADRTID